MRGYVEGVCTSEFPQYAWSEPILEPVSVVPCCSESSSAPTIRTRRLIAWELVRNGEDVRLVLLPNRYTIAKHPLTVLRGVVREDTPIDAIKADCLRRVFNI